MGLEKKYDVEMNYFRRTTTLTFLCRRVRDFASVPFKSKLIKAGITEDKIQIVLSELRKEGLNDSQIPAVLDSMGGEGIRQLLASIERQKLVTNKSEIVKMIVDIPRENRSIVINAFEGDSLFETLKKGGEGSHELSSYLDCACGGIMACSTCHVIVEPRYFNLLEPPSAAEEDMLDIAFGSCETYETFDFKSTTLLQLSSLVFFIGLGSVVS